MSDFTSQIFALRPHIHVDSLQESVLVVWFPGMTDTSKESSSGGPFIASADGVL